MSAALTLAAGDWFRVEDGYVHRTGWRVEPVAGNPEVSPEMRDHPDPWGVFDAMGELVATTNGRDDAVTLAAPTTPVTNQPKD